MKHLVLVIMIVGLASTNLFGQQNSTTATPDELYKQAVKQFEAGDIDAAFDSINKGIDEKQLAKMLSLRANIFYTTSNLLLLQGKINTNLIPNAIRDYTNAIALDPNFRDAYLGRATVYNRLMSKEDKEKAIGDYTKAIELDPKEPDAYLGRTQPYISRGMFEEALADFNKAVELAPELAVVYIARGNYYAEKGDDKLALEDYNKAIKIEPKNAQAYSDRGELYVELKDFENAIDDFTRAIELEPNSSSNYWKRAEAFRESNKFQMAVADLEKSIKLNANERLDFSDTLYNDLGETYFKFGKFQLAVENFTKAINGTSNPYSFYYANRAEAFCKLGEKEKAQIDEQKFISLGGKVENPCK